MTARVAACACEQLQVRCTGEPVKVSLCHCLECQRRTGSAFGIAAFFDTAAVTVSGTATTYRRDADSGFPVTFNFCPACGSTVFWYPARLPSLVAVAVGCFADPGFQAPSQSVYDRHRHPWVVPPA